MNVKVGGISLEQYSSTNCRFEELQYALENVQIMPYDYFDFLGQEAGILGSMIKGSVKGTVGAVRTGVKGAKLVKKGINQGSTSIKNLWAKIKPQLIQLLKMFGNALTDMWNKFMQYDKQYKELGKKINNIVQYSINQMQHMPSVTVYYHKFNAILLKELIDLVANFTNFFVTLTTKTSKGDPGVFENEVCADMEQMSNLIKTGKVDEFRRQTQIFANGIQKFNSYGELTIPVVLDKLYRWNVSKNLPSDMRKLAESNKLSISDYFKAAILGEQIEASYSDENKDEFIEDMTGNNDSFLRLVQSILNNEILADALKKGGASTKKATDAMVKLAEKIMKEAEVKERVDEDKRQREEAAKARETQLKQASNNMKQNMPGGKYDKEATDIVEKGQQFGKLGDNVEAAQGEGETLADTVGNYTKNYIMLINKISSAYANMVRGILSATYVIISEAGSVCSTIEAAAARKSY